MTTLRRIFLALLLASALFFVVSATARAQTASLVRDIGTSGSTDAFNLQQITLAQGKIFFVSPLGSTSSPWVTDGTQAGTHPLLELCAGISCSAEGVRILGALGGVALWSRQQDGLWRSDGSRAGTWRLDGPEEDFRLDANGVFFGGAYLSSGCAESVCGLWRTDGTPGGTRSVKEIRNTGNFTVAASRVFFTVVRSDGTSGLWITDGTAGGTREVVSAPPFRSAGRPTAAGDRVFFVADSPAGLQMWSSDGTAAGTVMLTHLPAASYPFTPFPDQGRGFWIKTVGRQAYFIADDILHGQELWRSDGTPAGTRRITDFGTPEPFPYNAGPDLLQVVAGGRVVFQADDGLHGTMVWMTDGDPAKTALLRCSGPCPEHSFEQSVLYRSGSRAVWVAQGSNGQPALWSTDGTPGGTAEIFAGCSEAACLAERTFLTWPQGVSFVAFDAVHGGELWLTDGTRAGTKRLTDLPAISPFDTQEPPTAVTDGRKVVFTAPVPNGSGLWIADAAGTRLLTALPDDRPSSFPDQIVPFAGGVAFTASPGDVSREVWAAAPNAELTARLTEPTPAHSPEATGLTPAGGYLFYLDRGFPTGIDLWRTDGTPQGTLQLTPSGQFNGTGVELHGKLYFPVRRQTPEIWQSDGTPAGTVPAFQITGTPDYASPTGLTAAGGLLYFIMPTESPSAAVLWRSDGTPAGTRRLAGPLSITPGFTALGSAVYFFAASAGRAQLWRTDGTEGGTVPVGGFGPPSASAALTAYNGRLYFPGQTEQGRSALWSSDGTPAGTIVLREVDFEDFDLTAPLLAGAGGRLYFAARDEEHGSELWSTDGTPAGTVLVRDIAPGKRSGKVRHLAAGGGRVWFSADDGVHGSELWQSDGTAGGTRLAQDIAPEGLSSSPQHLTAIGERLWFSADDGVTGRELWSLPLADPGTCHPGPSRLCLAGGRYQVEASWYTGPTTQGRGTAVALSADTGYFWFFSPTNVETVVKVLDGEGLNGHVWVFFGALSNVEYTITVTDTRNGLTRRYFNPQGQFASVGDTHGFGPLGANSIDREPPVAIAAPSLLPLVSERIGKAATAPCQASAQRLCLNDNRFAVEVAWKDFQNHQGKGTAVPLTGDTGTFWFFNAANIELVVKALDGRPLNNHFWLFYGALSNVEYTLTVTDTQTGIIRAYTNPSGRFASVGDTSAF